MTRACFALIAMVGLALAPASAQAGPSNSLAKDASTHFQRGVSLFSEADYRAALVEFRRAYDIAPKTAVLYNIGQTYYQLQNYAAALTALQRYLTESPATAPHRAEVVQTLEILATRVGKVSVTCNAPGASITVDDEPAGTTPLREPVLVSVGHRKITATRDGHSDTKFVEVPAGETAPVALVIADLPARPSTAPDRPLGDRLILPGWIATGVLGAGAVTAGVLAYLASRDLDRERERFPASATALDRAASRVSTRSAIADVLGIATIVTGAITLKLTLSRSRTHEVHVAVRPMGLQIAGSFP